MSNLTGDFSQETADRYSALEILLQNLGENSMWFRSCGINAMSADIEYLMNQASEAEVADYLSHCDDDFDPPLSVRLDIDEYAKKIISNAMRFEAWSGGILVGLVAAYCNDQAIGIAHITSVSVLREWLRKGIASHLMRRCIEHIVECGLQQITLDVWVNNAQAISLYEKCGFVAGEVNAEFVSMNRYLKSAEEDDRKRDSSVEINAENARAGAYDLEGNGPI